MRKKKEENNKIKPGIDGISDEELEYFGKNSVKMNQIESKMKGEGEGINTACLIVAIIALTFFILCIALFGFDILFEYGNKGYSLGRIVVIRFQRLILNLSEVIIYLQIFSACLSFVFGFTSVVMGINGKGLPLGRGKGIAGFWIGLTITVIIALYVFHALVNIYSQPIGW